MGLLALYRISKNYNINIDLVIYLYDFNYVISLDFI